MESPGTFWTAMAALVISLTSGALTFFEAMQGPQVKALPIEDVVVFASPADDPAARLLGAVARPEIANTAASYPDILLSQAIVVLAGDSERACLSARGEVRFHDVPAPGQPELYLPDAAETIQPGQMLLEIRDVSSRASLPAGELFSVRQLFDQAANRSDVDPCRHFHPDTLEKPYAAADFVATFRGQSVLLRYEARFANDPGYLVECSFELTDRRAELMLTRGHINVPCAGSPPTQMPSQRGLWHRIEAALDRLF